MNRKQFDESIEGMTLEAIDGSSVSIPSSEYAVHLQFRRYSGCPVCNLHLRSFVKRNGELLDEGIAEVVAFASSQETMQKDHADVPFPLIADADRRLFAMFGVGTSQFAVLHPLALLAAIKGTIVRGSKSRSRTESALGLPAEFLIAPDGKILALHYGKHASDHWSVDQVIAKRRHAID